MNWKRRFFMNKLVDKIKVLVVDDDIQMLKKTKERFFMSKNSDKDTIELFLFAIDVNKQSTFNELEISKQIEEYIDINGFQFDILLIDFSMANRSGLVVIQNLKSKGFSHPIIIMTAHEEVVQEKILDTLKKGAKSYLYKNQDYFIDELIITANRIMEEYQNEKMISLTKNLVDKTYENFEEFAISFSHQIVDNISNTYCIVRKYEESTGKLLKLHDVEELKIKCEILRDDCSDMFKAIDNETGININNDLNLDKFPELKEPLNGNTLKLLSVRVGSQKNPKGLVNIFRRKIGFNFTERDAYFIKFAVNMLENKIALEEKERNDTNILDFISKIIVSEDEEYICQALSDLVHKEFNNNDDKNTKLTIKFIKLEEDVLSCKKNSCQQRGVEREDYMPTIQTSFSISATVYKNNIPILINNLDEIEVAQEDFREDYYQKYNYFPRNNEEKFNYIASAKHVTMKSELCIPLAIEKHSDNSDIFPDIKILGVLNLESTKIGFYSKKDKTLLEILCKVVALRIDNLRHKQMLDRITDIVKVADDDEKLKKLLNLFKEVTQYHLLTVYTIKDGVIKFEGLDVDKSENRAEIINEIKEATLVKKGYVFNLYNRLYEEKEEPIYIETLEEDRDDYYKCVKLKKEIKSLLIQPIFAYDELVGVLTLEYAFETPLMKSETELLGKVANWLGVLYLSEDEHKKHLNYLLMKRYSEKFSSNFRHSVVNQVKKVEDVLVKLAEYDKESVSLIENTFHGIKSIPKHYDNITSAETFREIVEELINSFQHRFDKSIIKVSKLDNPKIHPSRRNMIYIVMFHILDNAFDVLKNNNNPKIAIESYIHDKMFYILLCNNGEKISNLEKIFEPTYTTKPNKGGFGLYHVRQVIYENDGEVKAFNKKNEGVYFEITLPIKENNEV